MENSPFPLNVVQPNNAVVRLRQPEEADSNYLVRRELDIALDATEGTQNMSSHVEGPDNENVPSSFDKGDDGLYHVKFVPYQPGTYKVRTQFSVLDSLDCSCRKGSKNLTDSITNPFMNLSSRTPRFPVKRDCFFFASLAPGCIFLRVFIVHLFSLGGSPIVSLARYLSQVFPCREKCMFSGAPQKRHWAHVCPFCTSSMSFICFIPVACFVTPN